MSSSIRETWIKAKYVDKQFIRKLPEYTSSQRTARTSLMDIRKWSVRKVRRRPRSTDNSKRNKNKKTASDLKTTADETAAETSETSSTESTEKAPESAGVLLFGSDLDKQPMEGAIEFSSDQESTGGEDDDQPLDEEDISKLNPDLLLYKAAAAHNLPVMCEALALGGDKYWCNPEDKGRSAIHQAILSVSDFFIKSIVLYLVKGLIFTQ